MGPTQHQQATPSAWVRRYAPLIPHPGPVVDLACGHGRHIRLLRSWGYHIVAVDRERQGVADLVDDDDIIFIVADLEAADSWPLAARRFAGIVVTNYLQRPLFPHILAALSPGGILIYETFAVGNERYGKPSNPDFLLKPAELLDAFGSELTVIGYEHGKIAGPTPRIVQRICAIKPDSDTASKPLRIG